ncbi:hypothetical protein ACM66B_003082 [Microbotryomycetes sp. NB124-2]
MAEHAGGGESYLSRRVIKAGARGGGGDGAVRPLGEIALDVCAKGLVELLKMPPKSEESKAAVNRVGWDLERRDPTANAEADDVREYIKSMPETVCNRLFAKVMDLSGQAVESSTDAGGISVMALVHMFMHDRTTKVSLTNVAVPSLLLLRIPQCTNLVELDLSSHLSLTDSTLAKVVSSLRLLEKLVVRGCTKVGDGAVVALSKATESRLKHVNLSVTAVTVKGLTSLLARCARLEALKLANVQNLNERAITKLVDDATHAAVGWRHIPLSNLRTLKLRSTDITDASLGRLVGLCAMSLTSLDISHTNVKTLDLLSRALYALPQWRLEKLVVSGLPLTAPTLVGFFQPLSERPEDERNVFRKLKIASIPSTSTKQPGLTDAVMAKVMPFLVRLKGLRDVSLYQNWELGKRDEPMTTFIAQLGRHCLSLDLTLPVQNWHLEGLFPLEDGESDDPPRIQRLVLDSSRITNDAAGAIKQCRDLRALHVAETRISRASHPASTMAKRTRC